MELSRHSNQQSASRRQFLRKSLQIAAGMGSLQWIPVSRVFADDAASCDVAPDVPSGIEVYKQKFENWSKEIVLDGLWTCAPKTADEVVILANWAKVHGWTLRPRGACITGLPFMSTLIPDAMTRF